jgi:hypothetical protein
MTTQATKDSQPDAGSGTLLDGPDGSAPSPAVLLHTPPGPDLKSRIKDQRAELIHRLGELNGDMRPEAAESRHRLKAKLSELAHIINWGVVDGWTNLGSPLTNKLEEWLTESTRQFVARDK